MARIQDRCRGGQGSQGLTTMSAPTTGSGGGRGAEAVTVMISLRDVSKQFPSSSGAAVHNLSLDINEGEIAVLVGPSGCGKTTTMRMINRLIEPTSGQIFVGGTEAMSQDPVVLR